MSKLVGTEVREGIVCNVCASAVSRVIVSKDGREVYQCDDCGLAFTHPQPESLADQYDAAYFDLYRRRRTFRLKRGESRLKRIELIAPPGRLLDIGCSLGYFVEAAGRRGWPASGLETSQDASAEAREMGLDVRTGVIADVFYPDESLDCVTMWDVLEHVHDPTRHMVEVRRILAPGGLVVIGTPNLGHVLFRIKRERWRHLKPAEHIFYFSTAGISRLLSNTGFDVTHPPVIGGRRFPGATTAATASAFSRLVQPNDVLIAYGVKNDIEIRAH